MTYDERFIKNAVPNLFIVYSFHFFKVLHSPGYGPLFAEQAMAALIFFPSGRDAHYV